jgi:hypothetical protein
MYYYGCQLISKTRYDLLTAKCIRYRYGLQVPIYGVISLKHRSVLIYTYFKVPVLENRSLSITDNMERPFTWILGTMKYMNNRDNCVMQAKAIYIV